MTKGEHRKRSLYPLTEDVPNTVSGIARQISDRFHLVKFG